MARILVTEKLAPAGLDLMRNAGHDVDVQTGLSPAELVQAVRGAQALVIRSATNVTREVLEAGTDLVVVGRAGIGLDNVDVPVATQQGVMVVNAPQSNIVSAAEHAFALLISQARNVPQASAALKAGRWERSRWSGVELQGKTLGVVGLGRIGTLVAQRAAGFDMRLVAYDPYVSPDRARQLHIELVPTVEELVAISDFVTIHVAKTKETVGLFDKELLAKAKPGIRIVNCARGGIVDELALAEAVRSGHVAGAGIDVFETEPCTDSPLFDVPEVVVTPHLGASTVEAQDKAGMTIAEMVNLALAGDFVPFAVNIDASAASEQVRPFLRLAERLGLTVAHLAGRAPEAIEVEVAGELAASDTSILRLAALKGFFSQTGDNVSYVNAPQIAQERGIDVRHVTTPTSPEYVNLLTVRAAGHRVSGTLAGRRQEARLVDIDGHQLDVPPAEHLLLVSNDDRAGMIAKVTTSVAAAGVSIADMAVGRTPQASTALMVISTYEAVPEWVLAEVKATEGILATYVVDESHPVPSTDD